MFKLIKDKYVFSGIFVMVSLLVFLLWYEPINISGGVGDCCFDKFVLPFIWVKGLFACLVIGTLIIIRLIVVNEIWSMLPKILLIMLSVSTVYYVSAKKINDGAVKIQNLADALSLSTLKSKKSHRELVDKINNGTVAYNLRGAKELYISTGKFVKYKEKGNEVTFAPLAMDIKKYNKKYNSRMKMDAIAEIVISRTTKTSKKLLKMHEQLINDLYIWFFLITAIIIISGVRKQSRYC